MKYLAAALACSVAACGSSAHAPRELDLAIVPGTYVPHYLQYRDGDGPWQQPTSNGDGTYALTVTDSYEVLAVLGASPPYAIEELRATVDDPLPPVITAQSPVTETDPPSVDVTGQALTPTSVLPEMPPGTIPQYQSVASGTFSVKAYDTSRYIYAFGNNNGLEIIARRSLMTGQPTDIGQIDIANEGRLLASHPVHIANASSTPYVDIEGPGGLLLRDHTALTGTELDVPLLPESMRLDDDRYDVTIATGGIRTWQTYRTTDPASVTSVDLPSAIDVDFVQSPPTATWALDDRDATLDAIGDANEHRVRATAGWLAATGATALTIHEDLPGFDPRWQVAGIGHVTVRLTLSTSTPASVNSVTMSN